MKVALVTGGSSGIGEATARELARRGWQVAIMFAKNRAVADRVAGDINGLALQGDVAQDADCRRVAKAVLSVYPLDTFVDDAAGRMEIVGDPASVPEVQQEVQAEIDAAEGRSWPMIGIERYAFYERAKQAYAVIQTHERRFYGCIALRKGVIPPDA